MIHDLKPYPAYKDSGVPWLGKVPEHWEVLPNRALFEEVKERDCPDEQLLSVTISQGVIQQTDLLTNSSKKDSSNEDKTKYKLVKPGDIAYNKMRAWQGAVGVSKYRGIVSPAYVVVHPRDTQNPNYFHYLLRTPAFAKEAERWSYGITSDQWSLRPEHFKMIYCSLPPKEEQSAIAHYLDHFDRRIRHYIHAKKKLIKLLEEQKQAIIHQAVTRGLDPNVKLKPSGVEWFGDVPEHWKVTKLYRITDPQRPIMYGIVLPGPNVEEGVFIVKGGNCEPGRLRAECLSRTTFEIEKKYARSRLKEDDIVYAIRGSIGAAELLPLDLVGANLTQDAARITPGAGILPKWLLYFVRSKAFFSKLDAGAVGATIRGINIRDLKRADVLVPPINEQIVIAEYLEAKNKRFAFVIERAQQEISLLREYRTRLIADVVTGKLDVRKVAANLPEKSDEMEVEDDFEEETIEESLEEVVTEEMVEGEL